MTPRHLFPTLLLILLALKALRPSRQSRCATPSPTGRYGATQAQERPLLDSGVTPKIWQGTKNIVDEFFPEAALKDCLQLKE